MKKHIIIVILALICVPVFSQVNNTSIKTIVEDSRDDSVLSLYRYRITAYFVETIDPESMVFLVEENNYIIPIKLQKNDLNAVNRFTARNLKKGELLCIEGKPERICIEGNTEGADIEKTKYRGLIDAIIIDNAEKAEILGTANIYLQDRKLVGTLPKPSYNSQAEGIVVVQVKVDQYGTVTEAIPGAEGTTTKDKTLWNASRSAALKAHFNQSPNAPALQTGTITYVFKLK